MSALVPPGNAEPTTVSLPRGIVGFQEALADEVFAFQREAFPTRRLDWVEPRWRWMFLASAARLGVAPMVWLYRGKQGIAAQQGAIPVKVQIDGEHLVTGWFVETFVLEAVRGKAVGPMLVAKAKEDLPFNLSLGQTAQMRELQFGLGWQQVAPLPTYFYVINGGAVVRGKVPAGPAAWVAGAALVVKQWLRGRRVRSVKTKALTVRAVARFDASHDALWARLRPQFPCAVVRDASYLNWKYCDQPGQSFTRIEVLHGGRPVAVVVFKLLEPDAAYLYCRALAVEIIAPPDEPAVVSFALETLCAHARSARADLVQLDLLHERVEALVRRFGFAQPEPTRFFLIATDTLPDRLKTVACDASRWLITRGDSDTDRPW